MIKSMEFRYVFQFFHIIALLFVDIIVRFVNPSPAEPGYTLPLQTV